MPRLYEDLDDAALQAKFQTYRDAREQLDLGQAVAVVAGEGRRLEFTRSNYDSISSTLDELLAEMDRRPGLNNGRCRGGKAIRVDIY